MKTDRKGKWIAEKWLDDFNTKERVWSQSDTFLDKNVTGSSVSVFRKTTSPKVIIESDEINSCTCKSRNTHKVLGVLCFMVICLIILMTFFLSLKTYNMVNEMSQHTPPVSNP